MVHCRLVLRIVTDDSNAICRFSMKFGADMNTARYLIEKAREIDLEIIGVRYVNLRSSMILFFKSYFI
jgi:ornithine decarboxylase